MRSDGPKPGFHVPVAMVQVGIVRVRVCHRRMMVPMAVRLAGRIVGTMRMLVMGVVNMPVFVIHCGVGVFVRVSFRQMEI